MNRIIYLLILLILALLLLFTCREVTRKESFRVESKSSARFIDLPGVHKIGVNICKSKEPNIECCKNKCLQNPRCNIISWSSLDHNCWQKDYVQHPRWRVGIKDGLKFLGVDKVNLPGHPIPIQEDMLTSPMYGTKDMSQSRCSYQCLQDPWCDWFIYDPEINSCWLYAGIRNPYYHTAFKK